MFRSGVKENAFFLKDVGDARNIRTRILECFEAAGLPTTPDAVRKQLLTFCLVGGGPTGQSLITYEKNMSTRVFENVLLNVPRNGDCIGDTRLHKRGSFKDLP